jgi:hypothetical protein
MKKFTLFTAHIDMTLGHFYHCIAKVVIMVMRLRSLDLVKEVSILDIRIKRFIKIKIYYSNDSIHAKIRNTSKSKAGLLIR